MNTHQTTTTSRRRRVAAVLLLPLLLVLGGCFRLDMAITINDNETVDVAMEVGDLSGMLTRADMDCSGLESEIVSGPDAEDIDFTVEDTETDGKVGCRITASGAPLNTFDSESAGDDSMSIVRDGDNYVFTFSGDGADDMADMGNMPEGMEPDVSISITFPGEVVSADDNAEIDGNTATWSGLTAFTTGGTATGAATGSLLGGGGGSSTIIWIVLGVVALLAIAALIFFISKKKQQDSAAPAAPYGAPAGSYGTPAAGYGQPPAPGPTGATGAPYPGAGQVDAGSGYTAQPPSGPSVPGADAPVERGGDEPFAPPSAPNDNR